MRAHTRAHILAVPVRNSQRGSSNPQEQLFTVIYGYLRLFIRYLTSFCALCAQRGQTPQRGSSNLRERQRALFTAIYGYLLHGLGSFWPFLARTARSHCPGPHFSQSSRTARIARIDVFSRRFSSILDVSGETSRIVTHSRMVRAGPNSHEKAAKRPSINRHNRP